jgi:hypothetical protein
VPTGFNSNGGLLTVTTFHRVVNLSLRLYRIDTQQFKGAQLPGSYYVYYKLHFQVKPLNFLKWLSCARLYKPQGFAPCSSMHPTTNRNHSKYLLHSTLNSLGVNVQWRNHDMSHSGFVTCGRIRVFESRNYVIRTLPSSKL